MAVHQHIVENKSAFWVPLFEHAITAFAQLVQRADHKWQVPAPRTLEKPLAEVLLTEGSCRHLLLLALSQ